MHILVVDDDIPTVEVIRTSLHWDLLGIDRVETAYDYTEAQNKICASQPDIILCDIEMPRGSGLDLLRWLREEKRDCEFVFLTCHANFDYAKTALQYGAADYITKPFNIAQTEATLSKVASQVRYHQELLQKSRAGQQWEEAHSLAQASFLHGLFMDGTLMTEIELNKRFQDLGLAVDALQPIHMVLATAPQPADDTSWKPELFGYAFRNLATELLCENTIFAGIHFSFTGYFAACGKSYIGFLHNIIAIVLVRVPGSYLASRLFAGTLLPMGLAAPAGSLLSVMICVAAYRWMKRRGTLYTAA